MIIKTNSVNSEQCCDVLEIELDYPTSKLKAGIENPAGMYKKMQVVWNDFVVYHNSENNFYLYNPGINHTWVVSISMKYVYFLGCKDFNATLLHGRKV